jgi:hypothetical protein
MNKLSRIIILILVILTSFLSLTALAGGIALTAGLNAPPAEQLNGTIFKTFTIPGITLTLFVGGSALLAGILLIRKNIFAPLVSILSGLIIISFEFVEVLVLGSPEGIARNLQIFYFGIGVIISILSISIWFIGLLRREDKL